MAGKLASLLIKISANGAEAEKELRTLEKKMANTAKEFEKVGKTMSKYVTVPLTALAGVSVAAANTQVQAEAKLLNALKGREDVQKRLIAQAGELQSRTTLGDEAVIEQQAYLAALGLSEKQIGDTIEAAAQLSSALNLDLGSAVKNLAKTYGGMTGELGEGIPALKNLTKEQLQAGEAIKYVNDNYKGFAETAAQTGAGPLVQLKNTLGDVAEQFGVLLLPALQRVAGWLKSVAQWLQNLSPEWKKTIVTVGAVVAAIGPLAIAFSKVINAIKLVRLAIPALKIAMSGMLGPIGLLVTAVASLAGSWLLAKNNMEEYERELMESAREQGELEGKAKFESDLARNIDIVKSKNYSDAELAAEIKRYIEESGRLKGRGESHYDVDMMLNALLAVRKERENEKKALEEQRKAEVDLRSEEEARLGIIGQLQKKISDLEKAKSAANSEDEIKRINGLLEQTRAELERVSNLKDVEIEVVAKVETPASLEPWGVSLSTDQLAQHISDSLDGTALSKFREFWDNLSVEAKRGSETVAQIGSTLKSSLSSLATTLGEGLANVLSDNKTEGFNLKLSMLNALGNALKTLGSALVSYGIAMIEFKKALDMAWLTPGLAITAGLAAVALGQGFINKANAPVKLANGGLAYGPTLAVVGDNRGAASDPEVIAPLSKLRNYMGGQQLELVGGVSFELRGDVARAIINRENVRLNRKG